MKVKSVKKEAALKATSEFEEIELLKKRCIEEAPESGTKPSK